MLDTLMVLWTRGVCVRFLRSLLVFVILFVSICLLLFFVTDSDVKWPGLAFTASQEGAGTTPSAHILSASTPTPMVFSIPVILQNHAVARATPQDVATLPVENRLLPAGQHKPVHSPIVRPTPHHELLPTPETSDQPPVSDWLSNAVSAHGHLNGGLIDAPDELESLFWPALVATILTLGICFVCFLLFRHKRHFQV